MSPIFTRAGHHAIGAIALTVLVVVIAPVVPASAVDVSAPGKAVSEGQPLSTTLDRLPPARNSETKLQPNTIRLLRLIEKTFPYYATEGSIYGWREDAIADHPSGQALDTMMKGGARSPDDVATGHTIAAFFMANARELGIVYLVWRQHIWYPGREWRKLGDRNDWTQNHMDHIHALVKGSYQPSGSLIAPTEIKTSDSMPNMTQIRQAIAARIKDLTRAAVVTKRGVATARSALVGVKTKRRLRESGVKDSQDKVDSMAREAYMFGADVELASTAVGWFAEPETISMTTMVTERESRLRKDGYEGAKVSLAAAASEVSAARRNVEAAKKAHFDAKRALELAKDPLII